MPERVWTDLQSKKWIMLCCYGENRCLPEMITENPVRFQRQVILIFQKESVEASDIIQQLQGVFRKNCQIGERNRVLGQSI